MAPMHSEIHIFTGFFLHYEQLFINEPHMKQIKAYGDGTSKIRSWIL